jgi:hypothetical protein
MAVMGSADHMTPRISGCFDMIIYDVKLNPCCMFDYK